MDQHKGGGHKSKVMKYFQRAATFSITRRPLSPGHDRAISGPIAPLVPVEARRRRSRVSGRFLDVEQEPTSPKVSCMGQIKHKKAMHRFKSKKQANDKRKVEKKVDKDKNKNPELSSSSGFSKFLKGKLKPAEKAVVVGTDESDQAPQLPPAIGQMGRFASGRRDMIRGFDWKVSDVSENHGSDDEEEELRVSHSGPISTGGGGDEQRKEVNLWKRRTMVPPRPLQLS